MAMDFESKGRSIGSLPGSKFRRKPMSQINVTPFVDVMLVLLIVFMVTAPLLTVGVTVDLPKTAASRIVGQDEPLVVTINERGKIFLQNRHPLLPPHDPPNPNRIKALPPPKKSFFPNPLRSQMAL